MKYAPIHEAQAQRPHPPYPSLALTVALCVLAHASPLHAEDRKQALVLMVDAYADGATDSRSRKVGELPVDDEDTEVGRGPAFALSLSYLRVVADSMRVGGTFRYLSAYSFEPDDEESQDGKQELGELMEVAAKFEYALGLTDKIDAILGVEMGIAVLLAGGDLNDELNTLEGEGFNVWGTPRLGLLAGPELAIGYELSDWLSARAGVALLYNKFYLYDASTDDDIGEVSRTFTLMRLRTGVGLEARF